MAEGGRRIIGQFKDEGKSAYRGNRGQGLADVIDTAIAAADEFGSAELWVQHTDRLARGSGRKGGARNLAALFFEMEELGVQLRSVEDDHNLEDAIRAVLIGERNYEDSRRKGEATAAGILRAAERGQFLGPEVPTGYRPHGKGDERRIYPTEDRWVVLRIFREFVHRRSMTATVKGLNKGRVPPRSVSLWRQATVSKILQNPAFIGKIRHKPTGQIFEGRLASLPGPLSDPPRERPGNERVQKGPDAYPVPSG